MNQSVPNDYGPSIGKENVLTYDDNEDNQARDDSCITQYNNQIPDEDFIEAFKQNFCGGSTKDSLDDEDTQKNGENIESSEKKTNKRGRKKKTDKTQRKHNKNTPNNIITKIKTHIINTYIISLVEKNSLNRNKKIVLKKLSNKYVRDLNTASNKKLLNMPIKKIFLGQNITNKCTRYPRKHNKITIKKIYDEKDETKKETNVIKILNLSFRDILKMFRKRRYFRKILRKYKGRKLVNKYEGLIIEHDDCVDFIKNVYKNIKDMNYIEKLRKFCFRYEKWFKNRVERPKRAKKNN
jgi:hypothetical protein